MSEQTFTIVVTIIGVVYVLTYAWAQLEILAYLTSLWKKNELWKTLGLSLLWAAVNCFAFFIAHDVHYAMIRQKRLVLYDLDDWWAKAAAVIIVIAYWIWVAAPFKFAIRQWHKSTHQEFRT